MFENAPRYNDYLADIDIPEPNNLWNQAEWGSKGTRGVNDSLRDTIGSSVSHRNKYRNMATDLAELHVKLQKKGDVRNLGIALKIDLNLSDEVFTRQTYQTFIKRYLRCVKGVDDNIKRVLDYHDDAGLANDTIIIYPSDQGFFHTMSCKQRRLPIALFNPRAVDEVEMSHTELSNGAENAAQHLGPRQRQHHIEAMAG